MKQKKNLKDTKRLFWVMMIALIGWVIFSANILFASITLIALEGYTNYAFWQTVVGGCGLFLSLGFIYDGIRRYEKVCKAVKNE